MFLPAAQRVTPGLSISLHIAHPTLHMPQSWEHLCWGRRLLLWSREAAWGAIGLCCSPCSSGLFSWLFRSMGSNSSILLCMQQVYYSIASNLVSFMCYPNRPHWVTGCSMVVMAWSRRPHCRKCWM